MGFEGPTTQSEAQKYHFGQKIGHFKTSGSLNRHPGPKYTSPNPTQARKKWPEPVLKNLYLLWESERGEEQKSSQTTTTTWGEISHPLMKTITHSLELI